MGLHWALQWIPPRLLWVWGQAALPTAHLLFHLEKKGWVRLVLEEKGGIVVPGPGALSPPLTNLEK